MFSSLGKQYRTGRPTQPSFFQSIKQRREDLEKRHKYVSPICPESAPIPQIVETYADPTIQVLGESSGIGKFIVYVSDQLKTDEQFKQAEKQKALGGLKPFAPWIDLKKLGNDLPTTFQQVFELGTAEKSKIIKNILKQKAPKMSVRRDRGTASSWISISGSGTEWGEFTEEEKQVMKELGLNNSGGNSYPLDYNSSDYYVAKWLGIEIPERELDRMHAQRESDLMN